MNTPTIEEQMERIRDDIIAHAAIAGDVDPILDAIINSLERLKRIDAQEPVEPVAECSLLGTDFNGVPWILPIEGVTLQRGDKLYSESVVNTLQAALKRTQDSLQFGNMAYSALLSHAEAVKSLNKRMVELLNRLVEWSIKYPSSRIYGEAAIRMIAKEIDGIASDSRELLKEVK